MSSEDEKRGPKSFRLQLHTSSGPNCARIIDFSSGRYLSRVECSSLAMYLYLYLQLWLWLCVSRAVACVAVKPQREIRLHTDRAVLNKPQLIDLGAASDLDAVPRQAHQGSGGIFLVQSSSSIMMTIRYELLSLSLSIYPLPLFHFFLPILPPVSTRESSWRLTAQRSFRYLC